MLAVQTSAPRKPGGQSDWLAGGNSHLWPSFLWPSLACSSRRALAVAAALPQRVKLATGSKPWKRQPENGGIYIVLRNNVLINGESVCRGTFSNLFFQVETFPRAVWGSFTPESVRNNEQIHHSTPLFHRFFKGFSHCIPLIGR